MVIVKRILKHHFKVHGLDVMSSFGFICFPGNAAATNEPEQICRLSWKLGWKMLIVGWVQTMVTVRGSRPGTGRTARTMRPTPLVSQPSATVTASFPPFTRCFSF